MSQINANPGTGGGGGGVELGGAQTGFTNGHVQFISQAGLQDGDDLFTFNSTTKEFFLQSNPGGTAGGFVNTQGSNAKFGWFDAASLVRGQLEFNSAGNSLTWEPNTMDDIHDALVQSNNVLGSGLPGSALARYDTSTSELAVLGTTEQGGVMAVFGSTTNPDDTIATNMTMGANADGGVRFTYEDTNTNQRSRFRMNTNDGNLWEFRPDILGDIETRLEQNNDILGLGILSGSALTWSDSSTQIHAIVGAVDGTAAGLYPGSTLIATNNLATGASASIATNYDDVLNVATVIANAGNGDFDSGFKFDDGRMVVRYKNQTSGFESAFESDINGALTRYKLNTATDEYSTQLSNGVFQFFNSTTSDQYMSLGASTGIFQIGDINAVLSDTLLVVNASAEDISFKVPGLTTHSYDIPITVKYTLSSSQLLAIGTTPIEVIAAPGAGKMVQVINVSSKYNFNTTNYATAGANFVTRYTNDAAGAGGSGQFSGGTNLVTATGQSNPYGLWTPIGGIGGIIFSTTFENQGISIQTDDVSDPTAGNGTLDVYITYKIVTL